LVSRHTPPGESKLVTPVRPPVPDRNVECTMKNAEPWPHAGSWAPVPGILPSAFPSSVAVLRRADCLLHSLRGGLRGAWGWLEGRMRDAWGWLGGGLRDAWEWLVVGYQHALGWLWGRMGWLGRLRYERARGDGCPAGAGKPAPLGGYLPPDCTGNPPETHPSRPRKSVRLQHFRGGSCLEPPVSFAPATAFVVTDRPGMATVLPWGHSGDTPVWSRCGLRNRLCLQAFCALFCIQRRCFRLRCIFPPDRILLAGERAGLAEAWPAAQLPSRGYASVPLPNCNLVLIEPAGRWPAPSNWMRTGRPCAASGPGRELVPGCCLLNLNPVPPVHSVRAWGLKGLESNAPQCMFPP
jgi:hypothetical protein